MPTRSMPSAVLEALIVGAYADHVWSDKDLLEFGNTVIGPYLPIWHDTRSLATKALTGSVDAAIGLAARLLPDHDWSVGCLPVDGDADHEEHHSFGALLYSRIEKPYDALAHGATPALAMCGAILKARVSQGEVDSPQCSDAPKLKPFCQACQSIPTHGYCRLAGCPMAGQEPNR